MAGITAVEWQSRIEKTLQWRQDYRNGTKAWQRYMMLYGGDHWHTPRYNPAFLEPDAEVPRDRITVNKTGATVNLAVSFLIKQRPKFLLQPPKPEDVVSCMIKQALINYEWKEGAMQKQVKKSVLDSAVIGHGLLKNGFAFRKDTARNLKKDGDIEQRQYIREKAPYLERVNPFLWVFDIDSDSKDLDSAEWCAQIFFNSREDVLANDKYDKGVISAIKGGELHPEELDVTMGYQDTWLRSLNDESEMKRMILYEVWDRKHYKYKIIAKGIDKPLLDKEWPYEYLDGFPYEKLDYIPLINEPYGIGIPYFIEDQQLELDRIRTTQFDHRRRYNRKYIALNNTISEDEINKLVSGEAGTVAFADRLDCIVAMPELTIPHDAFNVENVIKNDIDDLTGVDALVRGGNLPSRTSAAEIGARQQYTSLKMDSRVASVDEFVENSGRKILQHIEANYDIPQVVKIVGPRGNYWVNALPEDIKGEYDFEMETMSAPKVDEVVDRQQSLQVFQLIIQNAQILQQAVNIPELFKWLLEKFNVKDAARFFTPAQVIGAPLTTITEQDANSNTSLNLQGGEPPKQGVMNASDLREQMMGSMSGGYQGNPVPGVQ